MKSASPGDQGLPATGLTVSSSQSTDPQLYKTHPGRGDGKRGEKEMIATQPCVTQVHYLLMLRYERGRSSPHPGMGSMTQHDPELLWLAGSSGSN